MYPFVALTITRMASSEITESSQNKASLCYLGTQFSFSGSTMVPLKSWDLEVSEKMGEYPPSYHQTHHLSGISHGYGNPFIGGVTSVNRELHRNELQKIADHC